MLVVGVWREGRKAGVDLIGMMLLFAAEAREKSMLGLLWLTANKAQE